MLKSFATAVKVGRRFPVPLSRAASGGAHGGLFGSGEPVTYAGVTIHKASRFNYWAGEIIGAQLWFFFLFRAYYDWEHLFIGLPAMLDKELEAEGWDPETSED